MRVAGAAAARAFLSGFTAALREQGLKARHFVAQRSRSLRRQRHPVGILHLSGKTFPQAAGGSDQGVQRLQRLGWAGQHRKQGDSGIRVRSNVPGSTRLATQNMVRPSTCLR